jgi:hypothetical protein
MATTPRKVNAKSITETGTRSAPRELRRYFADVEPVAGGLLVIRCPGPQYRRKTMSTLPTIRSRAIATINITFNRGAAFPQNGC